MYSVRYELKHNTIIKQHPLRIIKLFCKTYRGYGLKLQSYSLVPNWLQYTNTMFIPKLFVNDCRLFLTVFLCYVILWQIVISKNNNKKNTQNKTHKNSIELFLVLNVFNLQKVEFISFFPWRWIRLYALMNRIYWKWHCVTLKLDQRKWWGFHTVYTQFLESCSYSHLSVRSLT